MNELMNINVDSMRRHHKQQIRSGNIQLIQSWISNIPKDQIDHEQLIRKAMLVIGCTRKKAEEYLDVIGF